MKKFLTILNSLVEDCQNFYLTQLDSTFCKMHQNETSRDGKTTKIHAPVIHDMVIKLLGKVCPEGKKVLGLFTPKKSSPFH